MLFEKTLANHDFKFFFADYTKDVTDIEYSENGAKIYYPNVGQENFEKIPGCPIGYWLSDNMLRLFHEEVLANSNKPRAGLSTTDNDRFLRFWQEVSFYKIYFDGKCRNDLKSFTQKWVPMTKGGTYRKWFGNHEYILNFENDGEELKYWITHNPNDPKTTSFSRYIRNYDRYCEAGISFSDVACGNPHFIWEFQGLIPNSRGPYIYTSDKCVLGFLNSIVAKSILELLCPTLTFNVGDIGRIPYANKSSKLIQSIVENNINISKSDWDSHETSWDFEANPLVAMVGGAAFLPHNDGDNDTSNAGSVRQECRTSYDDGVRQECRTSYSLEDLVKAFEAEWTERFMQLHENEEELNRQFIEIYGLQDELTPDVPLDEITILQQGEISIENK